MFEVQCVTADDTRAFAGRLASLVRPDDVILLAGALGAGKTVFVSGLAAGLGVEEEVVSPSFVLVRQYQSGFIPVVHADVYRLASFNEFDDLAVLDQGIGGVLVIEWGDVLEQALPSDHLKVVFEIGEDESRTLLLQPFGSWVSRDWESIR